MTKLTEEEGGETDDGLYWYCFRSKVRREKIAATAVRVRQDRAAFAPTISILRKTRHGKKRFIEPLFPGYFFARCRIRDDLRNLLATEGVTGVIRYGERIPVVPDTAMEALRERFADGEDPLEIAAPELKPGMKVRLLEGAFHDFPAEILAIDSGSQRVVLLLEFLGRQTQIRVSTERLWVDEEG